MGRQRWFWELCDGVRLQSNRTNKLGLGEFLFVIRRKYTIRLRERILHKFGVQITSGDVIYEENCSIGEKFSLLRTRDVVVNDVYEPKLHSWTRVYVQVYDENGITIYYLPDGKINEKVDELFVELYNPIKNLLEIDKSLFTID